MDWDESKGYRPRRCRAGDYADGLIEDKERLNIASPEDGIGNLDDNARDRVLVDYLSNLDEQR